MGHLMKKRVGPIRQCYLAKQLSFKTPLFVLFFLNNRFESIDQIGRSKLHPIVIPRGDFLQSAKISSFCYFFTSITSKYFFFLQHYKLLFMLQ